MTDVSWLKTTNAAEVFQLIRSNLSALDCSCPTGVPMDARAEAGGATRVGVLILLHICGRDEMATVKIRTGGAVGVVEMPV